MFGGRQQLSRVAVSGRVEQWLVARAAQIAGLELEEPAAARTAVQLIQALEEATEFQQLGANLQVPPGPSDPSQVTQYLAETRAGLLEMVKLTQAQDDVLVQVGRLFSSLPPFPQLQILADFSYGWQVVHAMTPLMQEQVPHPLHLPPPGEERAGAGGGAAGHLPQAVGGHGGRDGAPGGGREQGALPSVPVLLLHPRYLHQEGAPGAGLLPIMVLFLPSPHLVLPVLSPGAPPPR